MAKKSRGRQKIPIKKMKNEVNLQVTFSKRRCGLFKKASEICTLCGVDMAIVVFSPGNKCYGFGHPSLQGIIDRYQAGSTDNTAADQQPAVNHGTLSYMDMQRKAINEQLNLKLDHMETELNTEKKLRKDADDELKGARIQSQWKAIGGCDHAELARLHAKVEEFRRRLRKEAERRMLMQNASPQPVQPFFCGAVPGAGGRPLPMPLYKHMISSNNNNIGHLDAGESGSTTIPHTSHNYWYIGGGGCC
ncbi:hypothetical protein SAY87_030008 [Trapa incisa]|uniref:MADS-box domain-containing protein n=1 Tax=Trapa incisa TaxID=236973 RepID=A0AAN7QA71_9MYRT|nr:hypothetical protein SAY87_030008 [Trapa incisa]